MLRVGQEEIDAIAGVIRSGKLFRYQGPDEGQCLRFEQRYARYLGIADSRHVLMTSSGTAALVAALTGLGIGPGDEVLVPCHTFMATPVAVLAVGAIPVIVDIDQSITLSPPAMQAAIGPCTRAVIPVHMWGLPCDMDRIMVIAREHHLAVIEDACQGVGGGYKGRKLGSIGDAGAFSFNYYKNMTCGEGGAVVLSEDRAAEPARCAIDGCGFFWNGSETGLRPFSAAGSRASEIEGAMMNAQLDRIDPMLATLRGQKRRILQQTTSIPGLQAAPCHSLDDECGIQTLFTLPDAGVADAFAKKVGGMVCANTGRHTFNQWEPIVSHRVGHHPALNPFTWEANKACRKEYSADMCAQSLDILLRTVMVANSVDRSADQVDALIEMIHATMAALV